MATTTSSSATSSTQIHAGPTATLDGKHVLVAVTRHLARLGARVTFDAQLGMTGYGYARGGIDPDGLRWTGAHGVDERMPVATLVQGRKILKTFPLSV